jgi:hypothetical protein
VDQASILGGEEWFRTRAAAIIFWVQNSSNNNKCFTDCKRAASKPLGRATLANTSDEVSILSSVWTIRVYHSNQLLANVIVGSVWWLHAQDQPEVLELSIMATVAGFLSLKQLEQVGSGIRKAERSP